MPYRSLDVRIEYDVLKKPKLENPVFIEGLSGLGNVGMLAATHLIREIGAIKFADVFSPYFLRPGTLIPGVMYTDGVAELLKDEIYYSEEKELLILVGYYQGSTAESYFMLAETILDFCDEFNVKRIFTLGGYGTGRYTKEPEVYGATTHEELVEEMKKHNVRVERGIHGPITGISGILLGLGKQREKQAICLLGETHGEFSDPKAAKAVLQRLTSFLGIEIETPELDREIRIIEDEIKRRADLIREMEKEKKGDIGPYIG
ncbi:MAG: PAC2 family protein [Candidatus Syntropharchaeia archaeon]